MDVKKLAREGKSAYEKGDYLAAARAYESAARGYTDNGDPVNAAEMANNCSVAYLQAGQAEAAYKAVEGTPAVFAQAGDIKRQGMALGNLAAALEALDRLDEAAEYYQQSADVLEAAGEDQLRSNALYSLSSLQFRSGKQLLALASMQSGLEGVKHPSPKQRMIKKMLRIPFDMISKNTPRVDE
jgi:tetratricopeptide (TPR) repeat protein